MTGVEVLQAFGKMSPYTMNVMITGHATLQNAIESVNVGANAYIMKPIDYETLDKILKECLKRQQLLIFPNEVPAYLRKPEIRLLLQAIKDEKITEFKPSISYEKGIFYPEIEKIIPDPSVYYRVFEILEKYGILKREFYDSALACPSCDSHRVSIKFRCTSCRSTDIDKGAAIEHLRCGHIDKYEGFDKGEKMICPKCSRELKALGVDYRKPGIFFKCGTCGNIMPIPVHEYICGSCGESFTEDQLDIKKFFTFVVETKDKTLVDAWVTNFDELLI